MKKIFISLLLIAFSIHFAFGQLQGSIWYFGKNAGIDFRSGKPVVLEDGQLSTTEGCAAISDSTGLLLFYTDGITVWNKEHKIIEGGTDLYGDPSATQSGVIVPMPGSSNIFYLFTIDAETGANGFAYSVIDMEMNNGEGGVKEKNVQLISPVTEKVTAVRHRNNKDVWILTHDWNNNKFLAYLLTADGFNKEAVISETGSIHGGEETGNSVGTMKSSPDGSQIAVAVKSEDFFEVFDFDNVSGKVSNPLRFDLEKGSLPYGLEFSPNGSLLYVSAGSAKKIYQVNLQAGSNEAIINSMTVIANVTSGWTGALQIGIDGKIYVSPHLSTYVDVIEFPDKLGLECNYQEKYLHLKGNKCTLGFPTFIQTYFSQEVEENETEVFSDEVVVETGKRFILENVLFDYNKSTLREESYNELEKIIKILNENPSFSINISGHTDNIGNKSSNIKLSENRAKSVADYLISKGIEQTRIDYSGYGSQMPISSNETAEGRQKNRRVEFVLNKK